MTGSARTERYGRFAESLSLALLRLKGYRVIARRFRSPAGEIDLIVRRGSLVAYVEVKARRDIASAAESLGPAQRQRIRRAAGHFLKGRPDLAGLDHRFDVMLVLPWSVPNHIVDAWRD